MTSVLPLPTRDQRRSARHRLIRATSISVQTLKREHRHLRLVEPDESIRALPATRGDCAGGPRPCPYVSCRHHLYLDVSPKTGAIKLNFPDLEVDELTESCALDVADAGGTKLEDVGAMLNVVRERARQIELSALRKLTHVPRPDR